MTKYYKNEEILKIFNNSKIVKNPVIVLGNGFNASCKVFDDGWSGFLFQLAKKLFGSNYKKIESDLKKLLNSDSRNMYVSYPEVYDWLLIKYEEIVGKSSEKKFINRVIKDIIDSETAKFNESGNSEKTKNLINWCQNKNIPILTTNYDLNLIPKNLYRKYGNSSSTTDICYPKKYGLSISYSYPLNCYFSPGNLSENDDLLHFFAIWHINGMNSYKDSFRMNLRDYVSLSSKIRSITENIKSGKEELKNWVIPFMNGNLLFLGIGLDSDEIMLRDLLIERKRINGKNTPLSYYVNYHKEENKKSYDDESKRIFLQTLGIQILDLDPREKLCNLFSCIKL